MLSIFTIIFTISFVNMISNPFHKTRQLGANLSFFKLSKLNPCTITEKCKVTISQKCFSHQVHDDICVNLYLDLRPFSFPCVIGELGSSLITIGLTLAVLYLENTIQKLFHCQSYHISTKKYYREIFQSFKGNK